MRYLHYQHTPLSYEVVIPGIEHKSKMKSANKKLFILPALVGVVILSSLFIKANSNEPQDDKSKQQATVIATTPVTEAKMDKTYTTFGTMVATNKATLSSDTDGRITKIYFKSGQLVSKGTPIIQMDDTDAKADLATKQANLALSKKTYERHEQLFKYGGDTKQNLDQLASEMKNDKIAVTNSEMALAKLTIKAPFDGQLGAFKVNNGDYVSAGDALVTLVSKSPIKVSYSIPQNLVTSLKIGQTVEVTVKSIPDTTFKGSVNFISPTIDTNTGTVSVEGTLPNKDGLLAPGMFVKVTEVLGNDSKALVIPETALLSDIEGNYVYRPINGKATRTNIIIGSIKDGKVEVVKGLKNGDEVVSQGQQKLSDGDPIQVAS